MKVALIGTTAGCVLGFRADLIKALVARGDKVYAFALDYDDKTRAAVVTLGAIPIDYTFSRTGLNPVSDFINLMKLTAKLRKICPDVVFSYFAKPVIFGTIAARFARVPKVYGMLEGLGYLFTESSKKTSLKVQFLKAIQVALYKVSLPLLDCIVFLNSDDPVDLLDRYHISVRERFILGGIGLNLNEYPEAAPIESPITFLFIGRLLAEKGVQEFVDAACAVKAVHPETQFVLLGGIDKHNPGSLTQESLEVLINDDVVIYPGFVSDVRSWISKSSVFVLPSYREGVPRSTQEAMAMGRPIITTDVPGCRETVVNGVNGYIVPPWSSHELAQSMVDFIKNPSLISTMGKESRKMAVKLFDADINNSVLIQKIFQLG